MFLYLSVKQSKKLFKENIENDFFPPEIIFQALDRKLKICFVVTKIEIQYLTYSKELR